MCRQALLHNPRDFTSLHLLGDIANQANQPQVAVGWIHRALEVDPTSGGACLSLGTALRRLGRRDEALAANRRALELLPDSAAAHYNCANTLLELQRAEEALAGYEQALRLDPALVAAAINRGVALRRLNRAPEALRALEEALRIDPDSVAALGALIEVLIELGRPEEALEHCTRALARQPGSAAVRDNRAIALLRLDRVEEALSEWDEALRLEPDRVPALVNRGTALRRLRRSGEALRSYTQALRRAPECIEALDNLAQTLLEQCRYHEAGRALVRLLELAADRDYALGSQVHAQLHCCDWTEFRERAARIAAGVSAGRRACVPFQFLGVADSPAAQLRCARAFVADKFPPRGPVARAIRREPGPIRVAYLSADFRAHATTFLMAGLFRRHDRQHFEVTAVSFGPEPGSNLASELPACFHRFLDVRSTGDREVAELLARSQIDIAVDLKGFTGDCRPGILAHRPAPIQVSYLGYPGTTGAPYIDYILADRCVIPEQDQIHYSEKVVYLPDCYQVNDSQRYIGEQTPTRAQAGLPAQGFVFCCFNANYKITPQVFAIWMRLLVAVPGSVLWLLRGNAEAEANLKSHAHRHGIAPERLVFAPWMGLEEHLARHRLADLFLDTLPINAHTTASDALWAGLPVLTCMGNTFAGRVAGSLLHTLGLDSLITTDLERYEQRALQLALHPEELAALREALGRRRLTSALFDTDRSRRHIEAAYILMWERHQCGEPPAAFCVAPNSPSS